MIGSGILLALLLAQAPSAAAGAPSLTLEEALAEAKARNQDLKAARARLEQARELVWKAWSYHLPQVTAGGSYTRNDVPDVTFPTPEGYYIRDLGAPVGPPAGGEVPGAPTPYAIVPFGIKDAVVQKQNQWAAQAQLTQALLAPALWFGISSANLAAEASAHATAAAEQEVLFGVASLFYGAAGLKQAVAVAERVLAIDVAHEKDARVRYQAGTTPKVTLLRAEIDRARAEQDLKTAQNAYDSARVALSTALDRGDGAFEVVVPASPPLPPDLSELERTGQAERPEIKAAETGYVLAERNHQGVMARYAPSVGAFALYRYTNTVGFTDKTTAWALGLNLTWNILDGGLRESDLRETSARIAEADANRRGAALRVRDEVRRARLDHESALANTAKAREQVELARENARLVDVSFKAGAATYLEKTDATTTLANAELALVVESIKADLSALRLVKASGTWKP